MLKFLKNPFGKKEEKVQRKSADRHTDDVKDAKKDTKDDKKATEDLRKKKQDKKPSDKEAKVSDSKDAKDTKLEAGYGIILKPHATEKTASLGSFDTYSFIVSRNANKIEIKKAFWRMYGIKPVKIQIINMPAKKTSFKRQAGQKSAWKKAYIRVPKDSNISVYEGV